jgi:type IV pilus assembly protein PilN
MIRINLLPIREQRKKREGQQLLVLFALMLVAQVMGLSIYYKNKSAEQSELRKKMETITRRIDNQKKAKERVEKQGLIRDQLRNQVDAYEQLRSSKAGPANMMMYLAYVLTPRDRNNQVTLGPGTRSELDVLKSIKWNTEWDPHSVWLESLINRGNEVSIKGTALTHDDVAELSRRLESGVFFPGIEPMNQIQKYHRNLGFPLVNFELRAKLNYRLPKLSIAKNEKK